MGSQHQFKFYNAIHLYTFGTLVYLEYSRLRISKQKATILLFVFDDRRFQCKAMLMTYIHPYKFTNSNILK